jgi:hypothetical protein
LSNSQNRPFFFTILTLGLVAFPFWGFASQEPAKRVNVTVVVKELETPTELLQLPANNMPKATKNDRLDSSQALATLPLAKGATLVPGSNPETTTHTFAATANKQAKASLPTNLPPAYNAATLSDTSAKSKVLTEPKVTAAPQIAETSAFSYIWIGVFLFVAGILLGLLFGRPALLVSFVGMVFVAIGFLV